MKNDRRPKFFCEFCDTEVPVNARFCPKCGRFFASVCCPRCGKIGDHTLFANGCPDCGYAGSGSNLVDLLGQTGQNGNKTKARTKHSGKIGLFGKKRTENAYRTKKNAYNAEDPLPAWIYIAVFLLLLVVLKVLYDFLR